MKNVVRQIAIVALIILPLSTVMSQEREGTKGEKRQSRDGSRLEMMIPDLTDAQKEEIKDIHLNMAKESLPIKNQLGEIKAKLKTLQTAENPDMKSIEKLIDESAGLQASLRKKAAANHQEVRKLLTEEQRIVFDTRSGHMRARMGRQAREGMRGERQKQRRHHRMHKDEDGGLE